MLLCCPKKKSHWDLQTNYHQIQQIELHESLQSSLLKETLGNQTWAAARWERRILTTKPPGNDRLLELCKITNWNGLWTSSRFNNRNSSHITTDLLWLTTTEKKNRTIPLTHFNFVIWISRNSPPFEERPELIFLAPWKNVKQASVFFRGSCILSSNDEKLAVVLNQSDVVSETIDPTAMGSALAFFADLIGSFYRPITQCDVEGAAV